MSVALVRVKHSDESVFMNLRVNKLSLCTPIFRVLYIYHLLCLFMENPSQTICNRVLTKQALFIDFITHVLYVSLK